MTRRSLVRDLAPPQPPCFADRLSWLAYLESAFRCQSEGQPRVMLVQLGKPVRINPSYFFCTDCSTEYQAAMEATGRCWPWWLVDITQPEVAYAA